MNKDKLNGIINELASLGDDLPQKEQLPTSISTSLRAADPQENLSEDSYIQNFPQDRARFEAEFNRPKLGFTEKLQRKVSTKAIEEKDVIRRELIKLSRQQEVSTSIISSSLPELREMAKSNDSIATLLKAIEDPKRLERLEQLRTGKELSPAVASKLVSELENIEVALKQIGIQFDTQFADIVGNFQTFIKDNRIDIGSRRDALENIVKSAKLQKLQSESIERLSKILEQGGNLDKKQISEIGPLLEKLRDDAKKQDIRVRGTFDEMNRKLGGILGTDTDVRDLLEKQTEQGINIKDLLKRGGLPASQTGQGILSGFFAAIGLPGLESLLPDLGSLLSTFGKGGLARGALSKIGNLGKIATTGGIAGEALATGSGGLLSKAGGLLGKIGKGTPLLSGLVSAGSSLASGNSLGQAATTGISSLGASAAGAALGTVLGGPVGTAVGGIIGGIIGDQLGPWIHDVFFGDEGLFTRIGKLIGLVDPTKPKEGQQVNLDIDQNIPQISSPRPLSSNISTKANVLSVQNNKEMADALKQSVQKPTVVPMPVVSSKGGTGSSSPTPRVNSIDDHGLQLLNFGNVE